MTLSRACLTVSEQTGVISVEGVVKHADPDLVEDVLLIFVVAPFSWVSVPIFAGFKAIMAPERKIKSVLFLSLVTKQVGHSGLCICHFDTKDIVAINLWKERSDSYSNLHSTHLILFYFYSFGISMPF